MEIRNNERTGLVLIQSSMSKIARLSHCIYVIVATHLSALFIIEPILYQSDGLHL